MSLSKRYSFREVLSSWTPEKRKKDGTVTRFFHRPLSFPFAWFFLNIGLSPNIITYISIFVCIIGFCFTLTPSLFFHWIALFCFLFFGTLDCVDGDMARTIRLRKPNPGQQRGNIPNYGEWVDALGGYCAYIAMILGLGLSCMLISGDTLPGTGLSIPGGITTWMVIGSVTCAANLLMRLLYQSFRLVSGEASRSGVSNEKRLSEEIGITGWFQILYALGLVTGFLPWVLLCYAIIYCGGCLVTIFRLTSKIERSKL